MDIARDGAGRLVEHANIQSCCLQLESGRSLDQIIIRDFVILHAKNKITGPSSPGEQAYPRIIPQVPTTNDDKTIHPPTIIHVYTGEAVC